MLFVDNSKFIPTLNAGSSKLKNIIWFWVNAFFFKTSLFPFNGLKIVLLKIFGAKVGNGVIIKPNVNIKFPWKLFIGNNTWIGENVWIDNIDNVIIGSSVCLSQGSFLLTGNHNYAKTSFDLITHSIVLEDGVWIGAKAVVCPGVTCYSHAILTVGSIATSNLYAFGIYKGNPAIKIRERIIKQ